MPYPQPATRARYENYIGGQWVPPAEGRYFPNASPIDGTPLGEFARSGEKDIDLACDAAWAAAPGWAAMSPTERSNRLLKVADRIEANAEPLAIAECWGNGKPIRECRFVDLPGTIRARRRRSEAGVVRSGSSPRRTLRRWRRPCWRPSRPSACRSLRT